MFALVAILMLAGFLRWHTMTKRGFFFDELWITELSSGHGSEFYALPLNRLIDQPNTVSLVNARPVWQVPMNIVGAIHPPAFFVTLRVWRDVFGDSMLALRSCSATWSMAVVVLSFFAARIGAGNVAGLFAALLSAISMANIDQAQDVRGYTMLEALLLLTAIRLLTMRDKPASWARAATIGGGTLLMMFTHYFAAGACAAIALGAFTLLRGRSRWQTLISIGVAGVLWLMLWFPQMRAQLAYVPETADIFLADRTSLPIGSLVLRLMASPYRALVADPESVTLVTLVGGCVVAYLLLLGVSRRAAGEPRSVRLFWLSIVVGALGQLALLDLARTSQQLEYPKYLLLANPAICVLVGSVVVWRSWLVPSMACAALAFASYITPMAAKPDMRPQMAYLQQHMSPNDVLIIGSDHPQGRNGQTTYLFAAHALPWNSHRVAIVVNEASSEFVASLPRGVRWFYIAFSTYSPKTLLPGAEIVDTGPSGKHAVWEVRPRS